MPHRTVMIAVLFLATVGVASARGQRFRILTSGAVSSNSSQYEWWYTADADPENASNLLICGTTWSARDNANYGFVYSSQDSGATWNLALEDKNSKWVSEESCAFGMHGLAYFVADASKVDDLGDTDTSGGITRIWVSHDSGITWKLGTTTGFTDGSASVVDRNPGPNENRLYIFFNHVWFFFSSIGDKAALQKLPDPKVAASTALISYRDGDSAVAGPAFNPTMFNHLYYGTYMHQNLMLKDGSLLALFWSKNSKETGRAFLLAAQHTDPARERLSDSVVLFRVPPESVCNSFITAPAAYDATTNTIYATYLDGSNGKCKLMLTTSTNDGQTWSSGHVWRETQDSEEKPKRRSADTYRSFAFARNQEGVMALLWRNTDTSNCWNFATSTDDGQTYSHPMQLSSCSPETDDNYHLSDTYLGFSDFDQADETKPGNTTSITIENSYNFGENHVSGIAVSPDGIFHPVWIAHGGQLYTAAIAVVKPGDRDTAPPNRTDGWRYITNRIKVLYGGSQHYEASVSLLTESVILRNSGPETIKAPLRLEVDPRSSLGLIYPIGVTTEVSGQNITQYLDINQYLPNGELIPGATSAPIPLNFHFELNNEAQPEDRRLAYISVGLLTKEEK